MAGELERLLIRLEADTAQLRRALAQADAQVGGFARNTDRNAARIEKRWSSMQAMMTRAFGTYALYQTVRATADLADQYQNLKNRLAVVARSSGDLEHTQRRLMEIAQETRVGVTDTAEMYSRYAFALKDAGKTTNELLDFTAALQKAVVLSGASTSEAAGALRQFSQGLAADALRGQELNSVMEQMPPLADLIARKLGVTTGELRKLAEQGKITREVAFDAVMEGMTELDERFQKTQPTIGQGVTQMKNAFLELGEASGVFDILTKSMQGWSKIFRSTTEEIKKSAASLPQGPGMMGAGIGLQGNIRPPKRESSGGLDPWAASIIPPTYEEQLREMREQWEEIRDVQAMALEDLIGNATETGAEKMRRLTEAVREGSIAWSDFADMQNDVKRQNERVNEDMASSTSHFLDTMFANNKTAATASALINTYQGITKALSAYPPPYSYAMAAMQAAMGFAQVRAIQSTSKTSSGGGGAPAGGASSGAAAQTQAPPTSTMYVRGIGTKELFTGDVVRSIAESLLDYQRDGGKVVLGT